jgi:hypothetical protein
MIIRHSPKCGRTLQAALDEANPGDCSVLAAGIYRESVTLWRSGTAEQLVDPERGDFRLEPTSRCEGLT